MARQLTHTLQEAEQLLRTKKYSEAFLKLKDIDSSSLVGEEGGKYCLLISEAALHVGEYSAVCVDEALEFYRCGDTEKFGRAKFLKGWYLAHQGEFGDAKETLVEAYAHFLRCHNLSEAARVLNRLSFVTHHSGNIEATIENLKKCLEIYHRLGDSSKVVKTGHNLAFVYFAAGRLSESLSLYCAHPVAVQQHGEKAVLNFHLMSAVPHALKGDIKTAKATIAKCQPYLDKYIREQAIYFENLGFISLLDQDFGAADKALKSGLKIAAEIAPASALVSQIKRLLADLHIAMGDYERAEQFANEALAVAEEINERVEIAACWRVLAQIETHRHNDIKAREWYQKVDDWFKQLGAQYELAVTRYLAATSGLIYDGERTALLYLAREYFEKENVAHYVDKIDAQLRRISLPRKPVNKSGELGTVLIAVNPEMKKKVAFTEHIAESEMTVLLTGETGTGKDLLARHIHHCSGRVGEFVAVNAAALPVSMIESELFGYKQGSFTGAAKDRPGLFEQSDGGTFYLDEVSDASLELQAKLLRVLETRRIRRLGENHDRPVAFRLIAASNHDLHQRMTDNQFRRDLYHRLNEIHIELPPLRQRKEDIPHLVEHFLTFAGFDLTRNGNQRDLERLGKILSQRTWPGNIRQLRSEIRHLWLMSHGDLSRMIDLTLKSETTSEVEQLLEVLERSNWNRREAARVMGVSEGTIRNRIKKYNLQREVSIS